MSTIQAPFDETKLVSWELRTQCSLHKASNSFYSHLTIKLYNTVTECVEGNAHLHVLFNSFSAILIDAVISTGVMPMLL